MRSLHLLALAAAIAAAGTACGGDGGGNGPDNQAPTAAFTAPTCTQGTACTFTDGSSDSDGSIASRAWTFENGTPATSTQASQAVTFATVGAQTVTLTVTDNEGASDDVSQEITVTAPAGNQPPVADFTAACSSQNCDFTNTSTDADGTIATFVWDFGEPASGANNASNEEDPSHAYAAPGEFPVTLTVTDDEGASTSVTKTINVAPPATLTCGDDPSCDLTIDAAAKVTVTLVSEDCELSGNTFKVVITAPGEDPVEETLFTDGCNTVAGTAFQLQSDATFVAGTTIEAQVISGGGTLALPPALQLTPESAYPSWTLKFDDGAIGPDIDPREPDFDDLVISIVATPQ